MTSGRLPGSPPSSFPTGRCWRWTRFPEGVIVHVSAITLKPDPQKLFQEMDFSVTQFLLDGESLLFSPCAWSDLLTGRMRLFKPANRIEVHRR